MSKGKVVEFMVQYEIFVRDKWCPVVRGVRDVQKNIKKFLAKAKRKEER